MKRTILVLTVLIGAAVYAQAPAQDLKVVSEAQTLDPKTSAELQAFKAKVAAAHPGLEVVKVEADVIKRAVLAPPPPPPPPPSPIIAVFVQNRTQTAGMDDQIDGIRDRIAAELSGMGFIVMDSAEIGAAFNRYKITTAEERAGLVAGLFTGGSVTRVAQMLGTDYILTVSVIGASQMQRNAGDRMVTIYTLRMSTKVLDATTGGSVYGRNWTNKRPTPQGFGDDPMNLYNDLIDMWVADTGAELSAARPTWRPPTRYSGELVSFAVTTTIDAMIAPLSTYVDATRPVKEELRLVAGGITVELDGAAIGSSGGVFKARPGLHQLRVSRQWMNPWVQTVNISEGSKFDVALELSAAGFEHYRNKEALRAEVALAYAEAAFRRGCRINFDSSAWQNVTWAPGADASSVSSSTMVQQTQVQPQVQPIVQPVVQAPVVQTAPAVTVPAVQTAPAVQTPAVQTPAVQTIAAPQTPAVAY